MAEGETPFVERQFESGDTIITARFPTPFLAPGGEYQCRWSIQWPDRLQQRHTCGIDGIQALLLAMRTVHTDLVLSGLYTSGRLTYLGEYDLDLPTGYGDDPIYTPPAQN